MGSMSERAIPEWFTTLAGPAVQAPIVLRAGEEEITASGRKELLERSLAGEHLEIEFDATSFRQERGIPNRNFIRFREGALSKLGSSGKGSVFLRDHRQGDTLARGGTVTRSKMENVSDGVFELRQTIRVVKRWAVQGILDGTIDRFSIGWSPTGPILCTGCNASIRECWHFPGQVLKNDDGTETVVEFEFQAGELVETSAVPIPAVKGTTVDNIRAALGLATTPPRSEGMSKKSEPVTPDTIDRDAILAADRARSAEIRRVGKTLGISDDKIEAAAMGDTTADEFRKLAVDEFEAAKPSPVLDKGRPSITAGEAEQEKLQRAARDWMIHKAGRHEKFSSYAKTTGAEYKNDGGGVFRGMTLMEMARQCLRLAGVNVDGMSRQEIIKRTLSAGYQSRSEFPVALEGALNQEVLAQFALLANTWSRMCGTGSHADFRPTSVYRRGSFGALDDHIEGAEIRRKIIPDAVRELIKLKTKANLVEVTRETMIDDNLGLVMDQAGDLGLAAALSIELDFYALLAENGGLGPIMSDGKTLFHADHKNIAPASALSISAIDEDAALFAEQTDITGQVLALEPTILLVPRNQRGLARKINRSQDDFSAGEAVGAENPVRGQFDDIIATPRLKSLAPRRYTFAAVNAAEVFRVVYLNGQSTPMLYREEGFRTLGTSWKIVFDYQVGAVSWEGAQTNAGA